MRLLKYGLIGLAACLLLVLTGLGAVAWVLNTEGGTQWLVDTLESRASMDLSIGGVEGTLLDGVVLDDVQLAFGNDRVTLVRLAARWDANDLFRGAITLDELVVSDASYSRGSPQPEDATSGGLFPTWRFIVRRGSVDALNVESDGETLLFEGTTFALELSGNRLLAPELATRVNDVDLRGQGELRFDQNPSMNVAFAWSWSTDDLDARGEGTLAGPLNQLELHHELAEPFQLLTDGEILIGETLAVDVALEWTDLAWPGMTFATSPSGTLQLTGGFEFYEFQGDGALVVDGTDTRFQVTGSGDPLSVFLNPLELSTDQGDVAAQGQVRLNPVEWDLEVSAQGLDPSLRFLDWPGSLDGNARFQGRLEPAIEWSAGDIDVTGTLRGYPLAGTGSVAFRADAWDLTDVELRSGPNTAMVSGVIGETLSLDVALDAPQAELFFPELTGTLQLEAGLGGTFSTPAIEGWLVGRALSWRDYAVDELRVEGSAAREGDVPLNAIIDGSGLQWGRLAADSVEARINGLSSRHTIEIGLDAEQWATRLRASGGLAPAGWSGSLDELMLQQSVTGEWSVAEPVSVALEDGGISIGDFCLVQDSTRVCGLGRLAGAPSDRIELMATNFQLQSLQAFLPEGLSIEGVYEAALLLTGPLTEPSGTASITGGPSRAALQEGAETLEMGFDDLRLEARLDGYRIALEGSVNGSEFGTANLTADIEDVRAVDPTIRGVLQASWNDIAFLSVLSPDVGDVSGEVSLDVTIDGTLNAPEVEGRAQLRGGALSVPAWGLNVTDVEADALSTDLRTVQFTARGWAGEGRADLDGTMLLDPAAGWPTRLTLRGESLEVVRLPEAEIDLSPELDVELELPDIRVRGRVHVPRADLSLVQLPEQAATPSADTVIHGIEDTATFRPLTMRADLQVTLGEDVAYSGGGLTTNVSGGMNLQYESGQSAIATGVVELSGDYEISGQSLSLERGRLLFAGPLNNPGLDVRAVREIESRTTTDDTTTSASILQAAGQAGAIRVGVDLTGTLQAPQTRIFSEPAMSEADALSYLVFGRPLTGTGGADAAVLQGAAVQMGLRQALPVIQRAGESVGLDELTVQTTNADAGELMAGKFLSPRLYIRYTYGLFNRIGGLMLHFRLTDRLSLETRSGDEKSMDILYVVEKD